MQYEMNQMYIRNNFNDKKMKFQYYVPWACVETNGRFLQEVNLNISFLLTLILLV